MFACGLDADGVAYCWGYSGGGRLGTGDRVHRAEPAPVAGAHRFVRLAVGGAHACGLTQDGKAYCWGSDFYGQLGVGGGGDVCQGVPCNRQPVPVAGGLRFTDISLGGWHTCGIATNGPTYCWGLNNWHQLGNDEESVIWGDNRYGDLGTGLDPASSERPLVVVGGHRFVELAPSCGRTVAGEVFCWGRNEWYQNGTEDAVPCLVGGSRCNPTPVPVGGGHHFTSVSGGPSSMCGMESGGVPYCWGSNHLGELGIGTDSVRRSAVPLQVYGTRTP